MGIKEDLLGRRSESNNRVRTETQASPVISGEIIRAELALMAARHQNPFESDNPVVLQSVSAVIEQFAEKHSIGLKKYAEVVLEPGQSEAEATTLIGEITVFINMFEVEGPKKNGEYYHAEDWQKAKRVMGELEQMGINFTVRHTHLSSGPFMSVILTVMRDSRVMRYLEEKRRSRMS